MDLTDSRKYRVFQKSVEKVNFYSSSNNLDSIPNFISNDRDNSQVFFCKTLPAKQIRQVPHLIEIQKLSFLKCCQKTSFFPFSNLLKFCFFSDFFITNVFACCFKAAFLYKFDC